MKNYFRTVRQLLRLSKDTGSIGFCAIMVAVLWIGNIGGAYPILQVITKGESIQQWIESDIVKSNEKIAGYETQIVELTKKLEAANGEEKIHDQQFARS